MSFSNCIPFGDRAANGFIMVENGVVYRSVDEARERAMELAGTERYDYGGRFQVLRS